MEQKKDPIKILGNAYKTATDEISKDNGVSFLNAVDTKRRLWLRNLSAKYESFRGVISVLITSLAKKIEDPKQDIRYHKKGLEGGYSGRTFDTKYTTPFLKDKLPRLAMKEAGWLTRSLEQAHPFTLYFPGKIRSKEVKDSFLQILNDVEENKADPREYLIALFILLIQQTTMAQTAMAWFTPSKAASIDLITKSLETHFSQKYGVSGAAQLPVIAIYSIYELLMEESSRYEGKKLLALRSETSADTKAGRLGDVEITDENGEWFECIEIKHDVPIQAITINDAYQKFKEIPIERYYLLTTAEPFIKVGEEENIKDLVEKIKTEHGCEVIVNGIIPSLKYYLRLLRNPEKFVKRYTSNLQLQFSKTTEIKKDHITAWREIAIEEYLK